MYEYEQFYVYNFAYDKMISILYLSYTVVKYTVLSPTYPINRKETSFNNFGHSCRGSYLIATSELVNNEATPSSIGCQFARGVWKTQLERQSLVTILKSDGSAIFFSCSL